MKKDVLKVRDTVRKILENFERARNDNKYLVLRVWCEYEGADYNLQEDKVEIDTNKLYALPASASILRARRKLVEENPLLEATDEEIKKKREEAERDMEEINRWF